MFLKFYILMMKRVSGVVIMTIHPLRSPSLSCFFKRLVAFRLYNICNFLNNPNLEDNAGIGQARNWEIFLEGML